MKRESYEFIERAAVILVVKPDTKEVIEKIYMDNDQTWRFTRPRVYQYGYESYYPSDITFVSAEAAMEGYTAQQNWADEYNEAQAKYRAESAKVELASLRAYALPKPREPWYRRLFS